MVVTNSAGNVTSNAATLTVNPRLWRRRSPRSREPDRDRRTDGDLLGDRDRHRAAELSVAEERHRHQRRDFVELHHPGGNDSSDNGAQFTVVVTNAAGSVTSNAATLTVNPAPVAPSITTQPASQTVTAGQTATFSVTATGTAPLSYQWQKNGTAISGATSSSYTTPAETTSDNGAQFTVVVTNSVGSVTSSAATLTVNPRRSRRRSPRSRRARL